MRTIIVLLCVLALPVIAIGAETTAAEFSKTAWLAEGLKKWAAIQKLQIMYEGVPTEDVNGPSGLGNSVHKVIAITGDGFHHSLTHFNADTGREIDPFAQQITIQDGVSHYYRPNARSFNQLRIKDGDPYPGSIYKDLLLGVLPVWPLDKYRLLPDDRTRAPVLLRDLLSSSDCEFAGFGTDPAKASYEFSYKGLMRISILADKPFCISRREILIPDTQRVFERLTTDDLREIHPGLWLPFSVKVETFGNDNLRPSHVVQFRILDAKVNDAVDFARLAPVLPPGTIAMKSTRDFDQMLPGGQDLLEQHIHFMKDTVRLPQHQKGKRGWLLGLVYLGLGLGGGYGCMLLLKGNGPNGHRGR